MKNVFLTALSFVSVQIIIGQSHETIVDLSAGNNSTKQYTHDEILELEKLSDAFSGLQKIDLVNSEFPDGRLSVSEKWPEGAWGRGYQTWPNVKFYPANAYGGFWSCHPMIRDVVGFIRGHIFLYEYDSTLTTSLRLAKAGMDYLLDEQIKSGKNKGAYIWYLKRAGQEDLNMDPPVNNVQPYETAHALVALSEFYLSEIEYKRDEILTAIKLSTANLLKIKWPKDPSVGNTNLKALGIWSLSASYRVTNDEKVYAKILEIAEINLGNQTVDDSIENGLWLTGGKEKIDGREIHHDTKIYYHLMNIRGLLEMFTLVPSENKELRWKLVDGIKRGMNHVITQRLDLTNRQNFKLKYGCLNTSKEKLPDWFSYDLIDLDKVTETLVKLSYYSKINTEYFTTKEHESLVNLTNQVCLGLDVKNIWTFSSISYYIHFMNKN